SRLDGIPLAIELAAARVSALGVEEIARRLDDRFRLLTAGSRAALPRQQTLRASLDWSHALLTTSEQTLLRRLAVFSGGFPIDAVEAIVSSAIPTTAGTLARADAIATLASLVDKSLVHADEQEGESRYRLLETVRQFAEEKLREAGEVGAVCDAHLAWCTDLAAHAATRKYRIGRREAMQRLEQELDNLRGALEWSMADPARVAAGLNLAGALYDFWRRRGHLRDGRRYLRELLTVPAGSDNGHARAIALLSLGHLESMTGNAAVAREHLREAVARLQETGFSIELGRALTQLALANLLIGDVEEAAGLWSDLLKRSREAGDFDSEASACYFLGIVTMVGGDLTEATCLLERSLVIRQDYSDDEANLAYSVFELGHADLLAGDHAAATRRMRESLRFWHGFGDPMGVAIALDGLAWVTADRGQIRKATHLAAAASAQRQMVGSTILPGHKELLDATLARTRSDLGEDEWNRAWAEGQALTLEAAVAYALADPAEDRRDN
ncbi:MAG TPA: hypothetical protein VFZ25_06795, partial [Chloroflexota bacterium]|nr:hypothetical protein [Chloroflexota bacterium]